MKRPIILICVVLLALVIVTLFQVKHNVQNMKRDLDEINRELAANEDAIHVLKAEWAYLNEPSRIKKLSDQYLNMDYITIAQLKRNNEIKDVYLASHDEPRDMANPTAPTLKPILSSARGYR